MFKKLTAGVLAALAFTVVSPLSNANSQDFVKEQVCKIPDHQVALQDNWSVEEFCERFNKNLKNFCITHTNHMIANGKETYQLTLNGDETNVMFLVYENDELNQIVMVDPDESRLKEKCEAAVKTFGCTEAKHVYDRAKTGDLFIQSKETDRFYIVQYNMKTYPAIVIYAGK